MSKQGNSGEAKALLHFLKEGYEVYPSYGSGCSCDIIILKDNQLQRVSAKSTSRMMSKSSWEVSLRQTRYKKMVGFDKNSCDLVTVYIEPEDRLLVFKAEDIKSTRCLIIKALK
jgi:hypothetical protein